MAYGSRTAVAASNPCWDMYFLCILFSVSLCGCKGGDMPSRKTVQKIKALTLYAKQHRGEVEKLLYSFSTPALESGGWSVSFYSQEINPVSNLQEVDWNSSRLWFGPVNLAPKCSWTPDRPACCKSLYRLRYSPPCPRYFNSPTISNTKRQKIEKLEVPFCHEVRILFL